jgi:hypothetical protein
MAGPFHESIHGGVGHHAQSLNPPASFSLQKAILPENNQEKPLTQDLFWERLEILGLK